MSSRRALQLLQPAPSVRYDHPVLIELFRVSDVAVAVFAQLVLVAWLSGNTAFGVLLERQVRLLDTIFLAGFLVWWHGAFVLLGMYGSRRIARHSDEVVTASVASALGTAILLPYAWIGSSGLTLVGAAIVSLASAGMVVGLRRALRSIWNASVPRQARRILIVGSGPRARDLLQQFGGDTAGGGRVVGHIDTPDACGTIAVPYLGGLEDLESVLMRTAVDAVLIALPIKSCYAEVQRTIEVCERIGVIAEYPADVFRSDRTEPQLDPSGARAIVAIGLAQDDGRRRVKRALDILGATVGLVALSPIMLLVAAAIRLSSPGPIFFVQQRCGRNRRRFPMYKFRTMVSNAEALQAELEHLNEACGPVFKIRLDPRITSIGRFLRRTSLDELPQLFNVLRGDMSLVGPRPLPLRDVSNFSAASSMRRFSVRPGLTCLWQVNGRSDVHFDDWVTLDLQYIDRWSLLLDLRILARTLPAVLRGNGAA